MKNTKLVLAASAALCLTASQALAQEEPEEGTTEEGATEGEVTATSSETPAPEAMEEAPAPAHAMITPKGKIRVDVSVGIGLSKDLAGKPIDITPDIWYGAAPKLEVGVAHSGYGLSGFWGQESLLGSGVCLTGTDGLCAKVYDGPVGVLGRYALVEGDLTVAADAGLVISSLDPMTMSVKLGVRGAKVMDKLKIGFAPFVSVGVTERDGGNKESLGVPVDVNFMVNPKLGVGVQSGIYGPLDGFGDSFIIPVALAGMYSVSDALTAGAAFTLHRVAGGADGPGAADFRGLSLFASWHN